MKDNKWTGFRSSISPCLDNFLELILKGYFERVDDLEPTNYFEVYQNV